MADELSIRAAQERRQQGDGKAVTEEVRPTPEAPPWALPPRDQAAPPAAPRPETVATPGPPAEEAPMPFPAFPGMEEEAPPKRGGLDLKRLLRGIWARRLIVCAIAGLVIVAFGAMAFTLIHHTWIARVTLIKQGHQDSFQVGRYGIPFKPQNYNLDTLLDTLLLPSSLDEALRRSGVDALPRDLARSVALQKGRDSTIFSITVQWDEPQLSANLANNLADVFVERDRNIRRSDAEESLLYYQGQLDSARRQADTVNAEILEFETRNNITDVAAQLEVLVTELQGLEVEQAGLRAKVTASQEELTRLEAALKNEPEMIVQSSYFRNPLQKNLTDLEWELEQARGRYTDDNPKVADLRARISTITKLIESGKDDNTQSNTFANNPVREALAIRRYEIQGALSQDQARLLAVTGMVEEMRRELGQLSSLRKDYEQLRVKQDSVLELQQNLRNRVEETRVIMLRNETDFEILERARPPDEPEPSGRKLIVVAGAFLGTMLGLALAVLLELLDRFVRTRGDLEQQLDTPLILEFQHAPANEQLAVDSHRPEEPVAVLFRRFANDMEAHLKTEGATSLAVVSAERGAGRTLVAVNLAQALGMKERQVVLVDADLSTRAGERPDALYELAHPGDGLLEALRAGGDPMDSAQPTQTPGVRLIRCGLEPGRANALVELGSRRMAAAMERLHEQADYVIYDLPPWSEQETVLEAAMRVEHLVLVARSGHSSRPDLKAMLERMENLEMPVTAAVLTDVPSKLLQTNPTFEPPPRRAHRRKHSAGGDAQEVGARA